MLGRLNLVEGVFLGKEELNRQQRLSDNTLKYLIRSFGSKGLFELKNSYSITLNGTDLVLNGPQDILGIDTNKGIIYFNKSRTKSLSEFVGTTVYISLSSLMETQEEGIVTLGVNGTLTGVGTRFTEVLRSNFTKKGVRIYLHKTDQSFLIKSITSNELASVVEPVSTEVVDSEWSVIGCFSPYASTVEAFQQIYVYHTYQINVSPTIPDETTDFLIGQVTWAAGVPTFTWVQDRRSLLAKDNSISSFDYIIDSDESLKLLRGNSQATNILIKKGTYTYTSKDGKGLALHPNVRLIWAEAGSLIKLYSSVSALSGSFAFGYNNPQINSSYFYNLNIENNSFPSGYKNMNNLLNCTLKYTSTTVSYGYDTCHRLINCIAESVNAIGAGVYKCSYISECLVKGFATGFVNSTVLSKCYADCSAGYSNCFASKTSDLNFICADTANGGFNASLNDVPPVPPPMANNNIISFQIEVPNSIYRRDVKLKVYSQYAVASTLNFNLLIINSLNKEEGVNIHLSAGENFKEKDMSATLLDPARIYSITAVAANLTSDATYTYILSY